MFGGKTVVWRMGLYCLWIEDGIVAEVSLKASVRIYLVVFVLLEVE